MQSLEIQRNQLLGEIRIIEKKKAIIAADLNRLLSLYQTQYTQLQATKGEIARDSNQSREVTVLQKKHSELLTSIQALQEARRHEYKEYRAVAELYATTRGKLTTIQELEDKQQQLLTEITTTKQQQQSLLVAVKMLVVQRDELTQTIIDLNKEHKDMAKRYSELLVREKHVEEESSRLSEWQSRLVAQKTAIDERAENIEKTIVLAEKNIAKARQIRDN